MLGMCKFPGGIPERSCTRRDRKPIWPNPRVYEAIERIAQSEPGGDVKRTQIGFQNMTRHGPRVRARISILSFY